MSDMLTELGRAVRRSAWESEDGQAMPGVRLPLAAGPPCPAWSRAGWVCSRCREHTGRHAAVGYWGEVFAVWPGEVAEPCS